MPTQAEHFHSWLQGKLRDQHFAGFVLDDGRLVTPAELAELDPDELLLVTAVKLPEAEG